MANGKPSKWKLASQESQLILPVKPCRITGRIERATPRNHDNPPVELRYSALMRPFAGPGKIFSWQILPEVQ